MNARLAIVLVFLLAVVAVVAFTFTRPKDDAGPGAPATPAKVDTTEITMLYSTEKKDWIDSANAEFHTAHPEINVKLEGMGSLSAAEAILDGQKKPTVFSPADSAVLSLLLADWEARYHTPLALGGDDAPKPLLITPLVFAAWEDRADVLLKAGNGRISWKSIHDAVASNQGWPQIGGKSEWGFVKLGHTDPTQSNSGLQALTLMTMEFYQKSSGLTVADILEPKYQTFIGEIERGVPKFEASTGTFMTDMVRFGPSKYDIAVVYESLAIGQIGNAQGRWGNLKIYYPDTTIWSDHPVAILQGDWVSPAQTAAAKTWVAFLQSRPIQERALSYGFRPGDPSVPIQSANTDNPFVKYASFGVKVEIPPVATAPDPAVTRNLLTMWSRVVKK